MDAHALEMKMVGKEPKNFKDGGKKKKRKSCACLSEPSVKIIT